MLTFPRFLEVGSATELAREAARRGIRTPRGNTMSKNFLYRILNNRVYIGEAVHKGTGYAGEHQRLIDQKTWDRTRAILRESPRVRANNTRAAAGARDPNQVTMGEDNIFIHMTGMSDLGWDVAAEVGAHVSLAVPIEMQMRHGTPPTQKALDRGMKPSLSTDVECTMTADMFSQMRFVMTLQRMFANERALAGQAYPNLLKSIDAIRFATIEGARGLKLDHKVGSLTPGKEADIVLLDATALNVAPLNNVTGAVVTLMERTNVSTVLVAGQIKKWRGKLVGHDMERLRRELEDSRDYLFNAAGVTRNLFRV